MFSFTSHYNQTKAMLDDWAIKFEFDKFTHVFCHVLDNLSLGHLYNNGFLHTEHPLNDWMSSILVKCTSFYWSGLNKVLYRVCWWIILNFLKYLRAIDWQYYITESHIQINKLNISKWLKLIVPKGCSRGSLGQSSH